MKKKHTKTKDLFQHEFPNGNRIKVTNKGFTLWDAKEGRWVIDGSVLTETNQFEVSAEVMEIGGSTNPSYSSLYPAQKKGSKK